MDETTRWAAGIIATIILGLIGILHLMGRQRDDKQDLRADKLDEKINTLRYDLTKHVEADTHSHSEHGERLARLEVHAETSEKEIGKVRDMRHDINADTTKTVTGFYAELLDRLNAAVQRLTEKFIDRK